MDARAFERLVREHQHMVYCVAFSYCKDRSAAEDVAQEAFLKAFRSVDELREPSRMKTWLYSIARFTAIDWVRKYRREQPLDSARGQLEAPAERSAPVPDAGPGARVMDVVRELKEDHREIMLLRYVKGLSYKQIAGLVGSTPSAVGEKLHRIREMVRERLKTEVRS